MSEPTTEKSRTGLIIPTIPDEYKDRVDGLFKIADLDKTTEEMCKKYFAHYFMDVAALKNEAGSIQVRDAKDVESMALARKKRLKVRDIRIGADKTRKSLKEESNRYNKLVQELYKLIEEPCEEIESDLQAKEDFAKNLIREQQEKTKKERSELLAPYVDEVGFFDLINMGDDQFDALLAGSKATFEMKESARKQELEDQEKARTRDQRKIDRIKILSASGLNFDGMRYAYGDIGMNEAEIDTYDDDEFDEQVAILHTAVQSLKDQQAKDREQELAEAASYQISNSIPEVAIGGNIGSSLSDSDLSFGLMDDRSPALQSGSDKFNLNQIAEAFDQFIDDQANIAFDTPDAINIIGRFRSECSRNLHDLRIDIEAMSEVIPEPEIQELKASDGKVFADAGMLAAYEKGLAKQKAGAEVEDSLF